LLQRIEISHGRGSVANVLMLFCDGTVGFIDWLDGQASDRFHKDGHHFVLLP